MSTQINTKIFPLVNNLFARIVCLIVLSLAAHAEPRAQDSDVDVNIEVQDEDQDAAADDDERLGLGAGLLLGHYKSGDADEGSSVYGGIVRMRPGPTFGVEGSVLFGGEQKFDFGTVAGIDAGATEQSVDITAALLLYFPVEEINIEPYVSAGVGLYFSSVAYSADLKNLGTAGFEDETNVTPGYHLGFGAEVPISEALRITGGYRYVFRDGDFKEGDEFDFSSKNLSGNLFSIGFIVYFQ